MEGKKQRQAGAERERGRGDVDSKGERDEQKSQREAGRFREREIHTQRDPRSPLQ